MTTWLGFVLLLVPMYFRHWRSWISAPPTDDGFEMDALNGKLIANELQTAGKTRLGWWGQCLVALGTSLLMAAGLLWLALRIFGRSG